MKKRITYFIFTILVLLLQTSIVDAAGSANVGFSGDDIAIIGSTFTQDITATDITGGKLMGIGGEITVDNPSCLALDSLQMVDVNSDVNDPKFSYLSLKGTTDNMTVISINFIPGSSECSTNINIINPTISFTNGTNLKPATISKTITVQHAASNDATLKSLSVDDYTLSPTFDPDTLAYTVNIPNDVTSATITAEKNDPNAVVGGDGLQTDLLVGDNPKSITVTAPDGTTKIYVVNIHRISNDATLKSLVVGSYSLTPTFNPNTLSYTVNLPNNVSSVKVTGTPNYDLATVNGNDTYSGLTLGDNVKTLEVIAEDGTTKNYYYVNLHVMSNNTDASSLTITNLANNGNISYTPSFSNSTLSYSATVDTDVENINIALAVTGTGKTVTGDGNKTLNPGNNSFSVVVNAEDGSQKTITINIHKKTSELSVSNLKITNTSNNGNISYTPSFNANTLSYSATVNSDVNEVNISFTVNEGATVTGAGNKTLATGDNVYSITVTAEDGVLSKTYSVNIHKKTSEITLTDLQLINLSNNNNISYTPVFNKDTTTYNASVTADVTNVRIKFISSDNTTVITGDGDKTLNSGNNTFTVNVTSEDGSTSKTYTINIRKMSNDANLAGLKITNLANNAEISYSPTFNSNVLSYEAEVENNVDRINLKMLKSNNSATVTGDGNKNLTIGDNTFTITVTAEDGVTKKNYTIVLTRKEVITSFEFGHTITTDYITTVANVKSDESPTTVLDMKNQLDNDNSKLEIWNAEDTAKLSDTDRVGTGMIVKLIVKGKKVDSKVIVIKGDVNGDSDINIIDASAIVNHFLDRIYLTGPYLFAADLNADDTVNIIDASAIVNHFLDRIKIVFKP